jgi:hypothetical protein
VSNTFAGTDRFELVRRLGEGGFGTVYEAFDRKRPARVALKVLRHAEGRALYRFKREFRSLADISHPNLVALGELLTDGWHWFFTMELVPGEPMVAHLRRTSGRGDPWERGRHAAERFNEVRLRRVLPQLADALHTIHRAGIVHCDIKPSNVLVTPEDHVVVLDFGLVSEHPEVMAADSSAPSSLVVVGTPSYMAPEQAMGEPATPAADWYSVGVMLYEVLTGQLPFSGSKFEVIDAKKRRTPSPPAELNSAAPDDLAQLTMELLDINPERRPTGETVLNRVGRPALRARAAFPRRAVSQVFLGREAHLQRLDEAFETALGGEAAVAFVSGVSGMGKTALIKRFLSDAQAREPDLLALRSRCYERESMPYKAIDPLVDALAHHLRRLRDIEVARLLPRDAAILARVFPVLLGVEEVKRAPQRALAAIDSLTLRQRAAAALRDLLFEIAVITPLVLVIDDLQWGDIDSASMLQELLRPPDAPPMLVILACRSEDLGEAQLMRTLNKSIRETSLPRVFDIEVGALSDADARRLAVGLTAGADGAPERADTIARESRGNPFFVHQLAQHSVTVGGATSLEAVVRERVRALPQPARQLMAAIALSAQPISAHVAATAAGLESQDGEPLQLLRTSRLVRARSEETTLEAYHDRIREAVVGQLREAEIPDWHRRLASAWEQSGLARPETLVAHFQASGDLAKTSEYAAAAAEKAQEAVAFERAAEFYALLGRLETDPDRRREWQIKLGQALANAGRGREASDSFLAALNGATPEQVIELERRAATELIRAGYLDRATAVLERLLPKVGVRPPGSDRAALITLLRYRLVLAVRGTKFRERAESEIPPADLRRIDVLNAISAPLSLSSVMQGTALNVQSVWHTLRAGEPKRLVLALTALAVQTAMRGARNERRAQQLVRKAQLLATHLQQPWATGRATLAEGMVLKLNGHWQKSVERLTEATQIFSACTGVRWETETAQILIHDALYFMGRWDVLARELPAQRHGAEQRGDLYSAAYVSARMSPLVHLAADRPDLARMEVETSLEQWTKRQVSLQHRFAVCSGVDIELYDENPMGAGRCLDEAWPRLRRMLLAIQHHRIEMTFYRARVALASVATGDQRALRRAERDARRLESERAPWAQALAHLVRGTIAQIRGQAATAMTELESAEVALRQCDMDLYAEAAQYRRGSLIGGTAGDRLMDSASEWMRDHGIANPPRLARLLAPGPW